MIDTPEHIKAIQLQIWLQKSPGERLLRSILDNEALYLFWKAAKEKMDEPREIKAAQDRDHF